MLLALDIGNTNITIGVFDGDKLNLRARMATDTTKTGDQYAIELMNLFGLYHIELKDFTGAILSSVVPQIERPIRAAVQTLTGLTPLMVGPGIKTGINIAIDNPAQLGADLLVGAVAGVHACGAPCIVWDLGTATTVAVVDQNGSIIGGAIMAGLRTSIDSLINNASLLPRFRLEAPAHTIGKNTIECLQSGAIFGTATMIDGMCERIEAELGYPAPTVVTGGLSREVAQHCKREVRYDDDLLLNGLRLIYEKNKK